MFVCPACQTENRPTAKFCRKCGLRRIANDGGAVAVAAPLESIPEPSQVPPSAGTAAAAHDSGQPAPGPGLPMAAPADDAAQAESEDDFVEEITEEEVQKEVNQKHSGGAATPAPNEAGRSTTGSGRAETGGQEPESPPADQAAPAGQSSEPRRGGHSCPSCGSNVRVTDKFCIWCGERQPQRIIPKMKRCSECRTQLPMTANFCFVCGNDVSLHLRRKVRVPSELFQEDDPELFPTFEA